METQNTEAEPVPPPVNTVRETTQAKYTFTTLEIAELGKKLQSARNEQARVQSELESIKSDYKAKLAAVDIEQNRFGRRLDDGYEMREAFAIVTFNDPAKGRKTYRHEEGSELIREEPMSHSDFQLPMFRDANGKDATGPDAPFIPGDEKVVVTETDPKHGKTPVGAALNQAASLTDVPKVPFDMIHADSLDCITLSKLFIKEAKRVGWNAVQIGLIKDLFAQCSNEAQYLEAIRPHVSDPDGK
jgi:hypothetical protein